MTDRPAPPRLLFHLTRPSLVEAIRADGLIGTPFVFACESPADAAAIMGTRLASFMDWSNPTYRRMGPIADLPEAMVEGFTSGAFPSRVETEPDPADPDGPGIEVLYVGGPTIENNTSLAVITIDTTLTGGPDNLDLLGEPGYWRPSDDHAAAFFGDVASWMYTTDVPPEALVDFGWHSLA